MKKIILACVLLMVTGCMALAAGKGQGADKSALPIRALQAIQTNARDAGRNAAIYQWKRVNLEVDRIVSDEHKVQRALAADSALASQAEALHAAVSDLRSARLNHDVDRIVAATAKLSAVTTDLLAK